MTVRARFRHRFPSTLILSIALYGFLGRCQPSDEDVSRFLDLSYSEQQMALSTLPLQADYERQVSIYLEARKRQHPTNPALAEVVARGGTRVLPVLRKSLATSRDHSDIVYLLEVFQWMQLERYYCVRCDREIMADLDDAVARAGLQLSYAEDILGSIRSDEPIDVNKYLLEK